MKLFVSSFLPLWIAVMAMAQEPNEVIFKDNTGRVLTRNDLKGLSGAVAWEIRSKAPVPPEARRAHELGRQAGQRGENQKAIAYFEEATKLAPEWPYPVYDEAFTHLLAGNHSKALDLYQRVDQMAPRGFFTTKTAVHTLRNERDGKFPPRTYTLYLSLEWTTDQAERTKIITLLIEKAPGFAPGWKARALTEADPNRRMQLLERGLASHPDEETKGFLLLNKAAVLNSLGHKSEAIKILGEMALDQTAPVDVVLLAKKTIAEFISR